MASMIKGVSVILHRITQTGVDDFNMPIYADQQIVVDNVLVEPASNDEVVNEVQLYGKHIAYNLHIPMSDTNDWKNTLVDLPAPWNETLKTYGSCLVYDPKNTPLDWGKKIKAELYE